jgi:hypothetical protein
MYTFIFLYFLQIAETISWRNTELDFKERAAFSQLEISVLEVEHYKMGITYTSSNLNRVYHDHYVYDRDMNKEDREILRYLFYLTMAWMLHLCL